MSTDMLEAGDWNCPECDETNSDFNGRCHNCGAVKPDEDDVYGSSFNESFDDDINELGGDSGNE